MSCLTGSAIAKGKLSDHIDYDAESFYLACLFHDIGCVPENIKKLAHAESTTARYEAKFGQVTEPRCLSSSGAVSKLARLVLDFHFHVIACSLCFDSGYLVMEPVTTSPTRSPKPSSVTPTSTVARSPRMGSSYSWERFSVSLKF